MPIFCPQLFDIKQFINAALNQGLTLAKNSCLWRMFMRAKLGLLSLFQLSAAAELRASLAAPEDSSSRL